MRPPIGSRWVSRYPEDKRVYVLLRYLGEDKVILTVDGETELDPRPWKHLVRYYRPALSLVEDV